jgi:hypothetical protein
VGPPAPSVSDAAPCRLTSIRESSNSVTLPIPLADALVRETSTA